MKKAAEILPANATDSQKKAVTTAQEKVLKPLTHSLTYINSHGPFNPMQNTVGVSQMYAIAQNFTLPSWFVTVSIDDSKSQLVVRLSIRVLRNDTFPSIDDGLEKILHTGAETLGTSNF